MRCRTSPYHDLRRQARQIDLFAPIAPDGTLKTFADRRDGDPNFPLALAHASECPAVSDPTLP
jgi:hypothetical protein